jgi:Kdo2-lipid IVA lauroyltransferase/acyltransferase
LAEQHSDAKKTAGGVRVRLEFFFVAALIGVLGALPRGVVRRIGAGLGWVAFTFSRRLRRVGLRNLQIAYPERSESERERLLRELFRGLGWQLAEFCLMSRYSAEEAKRYVRYEGLEHYLEAREQGKGVLVVTGHLGAWELSSFFHSLMGYPMAMVIRRLDNARVDALVNRIRCKHGNRVLHKDDFARGLLAAMHAGETVGILMDTNMTPPQGVFVPYFGVEACTASGLARVALKAGAAVLPGFLLWEAAEGQYVLHFGRPLELIETGDVQADIVANTALYTAAIESYVRQYPEQWLWVHRRWKTRPAGEAGLY